MGDNFNPYSTQVYLNDKLIESDVQENLTIENFKIFFKKTCFLFLLFVYLNKRRLVKFNTG